MEDARLEPEAEVLVDSRPEMGLAARELQQVEGAHLRLVVGAFADRRRGPVGELAVARVAVARRREHGLDPCRVGLVLGLAAMPARRARARRHVGVADAPLLTAPPER